MKRAAAWIFAGIVTGIGVPAQAQQSEILFAHKQWQVKLVVGEGGTLACTARVLRDNNESFALWTMADGMMQLQFYAPTWDFGEEGSADLQLQIDRRGTWSLSNAQLYRNSVLFNLPGDGSGARFIAEVSQGSQLFLRASDGAHVQSYSLAGSHASITALNECGSVLRAQGQSPATPSNPFARPASPSNPFN